MLIYFSRDNPAQVILASRLRGLKTEISAWYDLSSDFERQIILKSLRMALLSPVPVASQISQELWTALKDAGKISSSPLGEKAPKGWDEAFRAFVSQARREYERMNVS